MNEKEIVKFLAYTQDKGRTLPDDLTREPNMEFLEKAERLLKAYQEDFHEQIDGLFYGIGGEGPYVKGRILDDLIAELGVKGREALRIEVSRMSEFIMKNIIFAGFTSMDDVYEVIDILEARWIANKLEHKQL